MTKNKTVLLCKFSRGLRTHDYLQRRNTEYINNINISKKKKKRNQIQKKEFQQKGNVESTSESYKRHPISSQYDFENWNSIFWYTNTRNRTTFRSRWEQLVEISFPFSGFMRFRGIFDFFIFPFQKRHGVNWNCQKHRPIWNTGNWIITNKYGVVDVTLWELFLMVAFDMGEVSSQDYDGDS